MLFDLCKNLLQLSRRKCYGKIKLSDDARNGYRLWCSARTNAQRDKMLEYFGIQDESSLSDILQYNYYYVKVHKPMMKNLNKLFKDSYK